MKKQSLLLAVMLCTSFQILFAQSNTNLTIKEQLENLNEFWVEKSFNDAFLSEKIALKGEINLIQTHLSLVEQKLRKEDYSKLSFTQQQNRNKCLDILNEYWKQGTFPINLYHAERTPYFIDHKNTACAVGQLIRETGHGDLAAKIQQENNFGYIKDLVKIYPEIKSWANEYGFQIDELAWIQPCYCFSNEIAIINVSCYGGFDGYFNPDLSNENFPAPYTIEGYYILYENEWELLWCGGCDLPAGEYKCNVVDANGDTHEYFATIYQPDSLDIAIEVVNASADCNGSAQAITIGGTPPYTYQWSDGQTTEIATDLCVGSYGVIITDSNHCSKTKMIEVSFSTNSNEFSGVAFSYYPNPVNDYLNVQFEQSISKEVSISIIDASGKNIQNQILTGTQMELDMTSLNNGVYFLILDDGKNKAVKKILKM